MKIPNNKRHVLKQILLLIVVVNSGKIFSQSPENALKYLNSNIKSSAVSDFIRYGNVPTKMNVGELDLNIPLMSLPVKENKSIEISLSYNASGFVPNKRSGLVGLNWNLNYYGAITREVKGEADDHMGSPATLGGISGKYAHGFMVGMKYKKDVNQALPLSNFLGINLNPYFIANINNDSDKYLHVRCIGANQDATKEFETTPDLFSFNFNDISGTFFMGNDGELKIVSNSPKKLKIDLTNFNFQPYTMDCAPMNLSEIKITDDEGNKYFFGGESKYLEYTLSFNASEDGNKGKGKSPTINTWFLKRIEYYNGEIVNYNFLNDNISGSVDFCFNERYIHVPEADRKFFVLNEMGNDSRYLTQGYTGVFTGGNYTSGSSSTSGNHFTLTKKAILDNIVGSNFKLQFNYTLQGFVHNNISTNTTFPSKHKEVQLDKLTLTSSNSPIKTINFSYSIRGGIDAENSFPRLFLDKVTEVGKAPHQFKYNINNNDILPKPATYNVDYWGYYNGKPNDASNSFIPLVNYNANGDFTYTSNSREPDFNYSSLGILNEIVYPTGGSTLFEYEPHTYTKRIERRASNSFLPSVYDVYGITGGTRIKKIIDFDGVNQTNIKEYEYGEGILNNWPRYVIAFNELYVDYVTTDYGFGIGNQNVYFASDLDIATIQSSTISSNTLEKSNINYSEVKEKQIGNGYTIYRFKDYVESPDVFNLNSVRLLTAKRVYNPENLPKYSYTLGSDRSLERGKLKWKKSYDESGVLKQTENFFYNEDPNRFNKNSQNIVSMLAWYQVVDNFYYNNFLTKKETILHGLNGQTKTTTEYLYADTSGSNQDLLSNEKSYINDTDYIETKYYYPNQLTSTPFQTDLISNNIVGVPLKKEIYRNTTKISEEQTIYEKSAATNNLVLPKEVYFAKFPNSNPVLPNGVGSLEKKITYDFYDSKGNIAQYTTDKGMTVTVIWGFEKTLPIAKIENATLSQVAAALGTTTAILNSVNYNENYISAINGLRNSLPNAMVTTYTHLPLIGINTITDPKGDVQYYIYDNVGRLKTIEDKNNKVISEYKYHYKNQ